MGSLKNCLTINSCPKPVADKIRSAQKDYVTEGHDAQTATEKAIQDVVAEVKTQRADVVKQINKGVQEKAPEILDREEHAGVTAMREDLGDKIEQIDVNTPQAKAIEQLAKQFKKKIVFFRGTDRVNGSFQAEHPDTIFINSNNPEMGLFVFGHELLHGLKKSNPDLYVEMFKLLFNHVSNFDTFFKEFNENQVKQKLPKLSPVQVAEEFFADFAGEQFTDPKFWQKILDHDQTLFEKIAALFKKLFAQYDFTTDEHFAGIQKAQDVLAGVLKKHTEAKVAEEKVAAEDQRMVAAEEKAATKKKATEGKAAAAAEKKAAEEKAKPEVKYSTEPLTREKKDARAVGLALQKRALEQKPGFLADVKKIAKEVDGEIPAGVEEFAVKGYQGKEFKDVDRVVDKILKKKKSKRQKISDMLRTTITHRFPDQVYKKIIALMKEQGYEVWKNESGKLDIDNLYRGKSKGYKHVAVKFVKTDQGGQADPLVREILILGPNMFWAKEGYVGHKFYEVIRKLEERADEEDIKLFNEGLNTLQNEVYGVAITADRNDLTKSNSSLPSAPASAKAYTDFSDVLDPDSFSISLSAILNNLPAPLLAKVYNALNSSSGAVAAFESLMGSPFSGYGYVKYTLQGTLVSLSISKKGTTINSKTQQASRRVKYSTARTDKMAPNGKRSNLTEKQYKQVRTPAFKKWFGDWEKAAAEGGVWGVDFPVSKVIDENGEPLVVYHGTEQGGFTEFNNMGERTKVEGVTFFAKDAETARSYSGLGEEIVLDDNVADVEAWWTDEGGANEETPFDELSPDEQQDAIDEYKRDVLIHEEKQRGLYPVFLDIKDPNEEYFEGSNWDGTAPYGMYEVFDENDEQMYGPKGETFLDTVDADKLAGETGETRPAQDRWFNTDSVAREALKYNDGAIMYDVTDSGPKSDAYEPTNVYTINNPNQAKSSTQNEGTFNPEIDDIRYSSQTPKQVIKEVFKTEEDAKSVITNRIVNALNLVFDSDRRDDLRQVFDSMRTSLVDKYAPIDQALGHTVYKLHRMLNNSGATMGTMLQHGKLRWEGNALAVDGKNDGFVPWLQSLGEEGHKFLYWVAAKRAEKLDEQDRENWFKEEQRQVILDDAGARGMNAKYEEWNTKLQEYNSNVVDIAVEAGLVSPEARDKWMSHYYLPFYRVLENEETAEEFIQGPTTSKKYLSSGIKTLKGGESMIGDPLQNLIQNWTHLVAESQRQMARQSAGEMLINMGMAEEMTKGQLTKVLGVNSAYGVKGLTPDGKISWAEFEGMTRSEVLAVVEKTKGASLIEKQVLRTVNKEEAKVMSYMREGKPVYLKVEDVDLYNALTNVNSRYMDNSLVAGAAWFKRLLTLGATFGAGFRIANFLRDTLHTAVVSKSFLPFIDSAKGLVQVWRKSDDYLNLMASGGGFAQGYLNSADPEALSKQIDRVIKDEKKGQRAFILDSPRKMLRFWDRIGHVSEMAARTQLYTNLKAEGKSHMEAAYEARDLLDFALSGKSDAVKVLTATIPFLNARMQGLDRMARGAGKDPRSFLIKGAMVTAASLALWAAYREDDRYKELEDFDKWQYHHFWIGEEHFRIPKAFEVGAVFSTFWEASFATMAGDEDAEFFADMLAHTFTSTFAMGTPAVFTPAFEVWANKSFFTGRKIEPEWMKKLEPGARANPWTSESLKQLGKATNMSPQKMQTLLRGYTATIGTGLLSVADFMMEFREDVVTPEKYVHEYAGLDRFMRSRAGSTNYSTRYHEFAEQAIQTFNTINNYQRLGDLDLAKDMAMDKPDFKARKKFVARVNKKLASIRRKEKMIWSNLKMSRANKRMRLEKMGELKNAIYKSAYQQVKRFKE